jgi:RNA-binding protein
VTSAPLSGRARTHLKSLAHPLEPLVQVGAQGITDALIGAVGVALDDHELIKVKLGQSFEGDRHEAAQAIAKASGAVVVQVVGRIITLYRGRSKQRQAARKRPQIELPR